MNRMTGKTYPDQRRVAHSSVLLPCRGERPDLRRLERVPRPGRGPLHARFRVAGWKLRLGGDAEVKAVESLLTSLVRIEVSAKLITISQGYYCPLKS